MIEGRVNEECEAIARIVVQSGNSKLVIDGIVDTGYTGFLTLPPDLIAKLHLVWKPLDTATLADGSEVLFDVFRGNIQWDSKVLDVTIDESDSDPLIGMALMRGYSLYVEVTPKGRVEIKPLP